MNTIEKLSRVIDINDMAGIVLSSIPAKQTRAVIPNRTTLSPGLNKFYAQIERIQFLLDAIEDQGL